MRGYFKIILIVLMISICVLFMCGCEKEAKVLLGHDAETELSVTTADMDKKKTDDTALPQTEDSANSGTDSVDGQKNTEVLYVYICGEVINPGVYEMNRQERVCTLIQRAGGLTEHADLKAVNQAQFLEDGQMVYIPSTEEAQGLPADVTGTEESSGSGQTEGKINLNSASREQLMTLPGIGEGKAGNIISYREEHGKFQSIEDLMKVDGIKEGTYEKLKDRITV